MDEITSQQELLDAIETDQCSQIYWPEIYQDVKGYMELLLEDNPKINGDTLVLLAQHYAWLETQNTTSWSKKLNTSNEKDKEIIRNSDFLVGAKLNRANLSGADLKHAYLSEADLSETDLSEADLSDADLMETDLSEADLSGARLIGTDLSWTIFKETQISEKTNFDRAMAKTHATLFSTGALTHDVPDEENKRKGALTAIKANLGKILVVENGVIIPLRLSIEAGKGAKNMRDIISKGLKDISVGLTRSWQIAASEAVSTNRGLSVEGDSEPFVLSHESLRGVLSPTLS